jgi:hypothetical protein
VINADSIEHGYASGNYDREMHVKISDVSLHSGEHAFREYWTAPELISMAMCINL